MARLLPEGWTASGGDAACSPACATGVEAGCVRCHAKVTVLDPGGGEVEIAPGTVAGLSVCYRQGKRQVSAHVCRDCAGAILAEGLAGRQR